MEHCKKLGLKGVLLGALPNGRGYPTPEDDRFWAAALDLDMPVTAHVQLTAPARAQSADLQISEGRSGDHAAATPAVPGMADQFGMPPALGMTQLALAGVFERFPKLKILFAETRLGWVPFWLEHMDLWYQRHLGWAKDYLGFVR